MEMMNKGYKNGLFIILAFLFQGLSGMNDAPSCRGDLFPVIPGWEKPDQVDIYSPETLWDIINGAADVFMAYDFQELYWGEYVNSKDHDIYIVLEIYRQGCPVNAFGVYSQERPRPPKLIDVGVQGYTAPGVLHFFVADSYVKIRSHDRSDETALAMEKIARQVSQMLDPDPSFPAIITRLPEEGKVEFSEEFINTNFLGHPFLMGAFVSAYEINGSRFNLFIIENENIQESRKILADYYGFSRQDPGEITEGIHRINDRWNGEVGIVWRDNILYGYYNLEDKEIQDRYLKLFSQSHYVNPGDF
jgi:hypothetical protein